MRIWIRTFYLKVFCKEDDSQSTLKIFKVFKVLFLLYTFILFIGCQAENLKVAWQPTGKITGTILPLMAAQSGNGSLMCTATKVRLFELDNQGKKKSTVVAEAPVDMGGKYVLGILSGELSPTTAYRIETGGCSSNLSRIVTGPVRQDLSFGTGLIGWMENSAQSGQFSVANKDKLDALQAALADASDFSSAYTLLASGSSNADLFSQIFQTPYTDIQNVAPNITQLLVPATVGEATTNALQLTLIHWSTSYNSAVEWWEGSTLLGTGTTFNYSTNKNSQGQKDLKVRVGKNDGSNRVLLTAPYIEKEASFLVTNTFPPIAPALSLQSPNPSNTTNLVLGLATGVAQVNCATFSDLIIQADIPTTPIFSGPGVITCSSSPSQNVNYGLSGSDGNHTLYLWARDASGQISASAQTVSVTLDRLAPAVALTSPPNGARVKSEVALTGTCETGLTVNIVESGGVSDTVTCSSGSFSKAITFTGASSVSLTVWQTDLAGNTGSQDYSFTRDDTAPLLSISTPTANSFIQNTFTLSGTCGNTTGDTSSMTLSGATATPLTVTCSGGSFSQSVTSDKADGGLSLSLTQTDAAGNSTTVLRSVTKDTIAPSILLQVPGGGLKGNSTNNLIWYLTETNPNDSSPFQIELYNGSSWVSVGTASVTAGAQVSQSYNGNFSIPNLNIANARLRISHTDLAGNVGSSTSGNFIIDSLPPNISSFAANNGSPSTTTNNIPIALAATDGLSNVTHLCVLKTVTPPSSTDPCWNALTGFGVTPALSVATNMAFFNAALSPSSFTLYLWVRDAVGNMSELTNSGAGTLNTDKSQAINFAPPSPPQVTSLQIYSTDAPSSPASQADQTATSGNIFIKWKVTSTVAFNAGAVEFSYSTDDSTYSSFGSAANISSNSGCTVGAPAPPLYEGCVVVPTPSASYFRVKIKLTNSQGSVTFVAGNALNTGNVQFFAGNTDWGLGGSAKSAVINPRHSHMLAVLNDGRIFINDWRGITWVNPANGFYEVLIPATGNSSFAGNGVPLSAATVGQVNGIYVDYQQNLLIVDGSFIRKVVTSTNPMTISTILGGGADSGDNVSNPLNFSSQDIDYLYPIGNGDIWFRAHGETKARVYHHNGGVSPFISTVYFSGVGNSFSAAQDITQCTFTKFFVSFDATQNVDQLIHQSSSTKDSAKGITGPCDYGYTDEWRAFANLDVSAPNLGQAKTPTPFAIRDRAHSQNIDSGFRDYHDFYLAPNGEIYGYHSWNGLETGIYKYNKSTYSWSVVAGDKDPGSCADGTLVANCSIAPLSMAINGQGQIFYFDRISRSVRTIDENGRIRTLVGDKLGSDDGVNPIQARFSLLTDAKLWIEGGTPHLTLLDISDARFRDFTLGGSLTTLAGNQICGNADTTGPASTQSLMTCADGNPHKFLMDSNNDIYFTRESSRASRLKRSTGKWEDYNSNLFYAGPSPLALSPTKILAAHVLGGNNEPQRLRLITLDRTLDSYSAIISGVSGDVMSNSFCATGTPLMSCPPGYMNGVDAQAAYDTLTSSWIMIEHWTANPRVLQVPENGGGNLVSIGQLDMAIKGFALRRLSPSNDLMVYYCDTNGYLRKQNLTTPTVPAVTAIPQLESTGVRCVGSVQYVPTRNSLVYVYIRDGLYGVAEIVSP